VVCIFVKTQDLFGKLEKKNILQKNSTNNKFIFTIPCKDSVDQSICQICIYMRYIPIYSASRGKRVAPSPLFAFQDFHASRRPLTLTISLEFFACTFRTS
jgi:hypothetical protein